MGASKSAWRDSCRGRRSVAAPALVGSTRFGVMPSAVLSGRLLSPHIPSCCPALPPVLYGVSGLDFPRPDHFAES